MKLLSLFLAITWAAASSAAEPPTGVPPSQPRFARKPLVEDYYPPTSRILKEQGTAKIRLCYDERGRVTTSMLAESSGLERLDQAAVRMGRQYWIIPRVTNGQPQPDCVVVPVMFSLQQSNEPPDRGEGVDRSLLPPSNPPPRLVPLNGEIGGRSSASTNFRLAVEEIR